MRERGILFSCEMVRAILRCESPKTQTRRVIIPQPQQRVYEIAPGPYFAPEMPNDPNTPDGRHEIKCPYGKAGDHLWVRETWRIERRSHSHYLDYRADPGTPTMRITSVPDARRYANGVWRPSIHMPRWASRITLEIVEVRVERVQDISAQDALAEGVSQTSFWTPGEVDSMPFEEKMWDDFEFWSRYPQIVYRRLWDSINAKRGYGWDKNPWVWMIEFKKV